MVSLLVTFISSHPFHHMNIFKRKKGEHMPGRKRKGGRSLRAAGALWRERGSGSQTQALFVAPGWEVGAGC